MTLPLLPYCATEDPPQEASVGAVQVIPAAPQNGGAQPETQEAEPEPEPEYPTYTVVLEGQPLFNKPSPTFGNSPMKKGTVLSIVGTKGKYLKVRGEGGLEGYIRIPKEGAGQGALQSDRYLQNTISSGINVGNVTKGLGTDKDALSNGQPEEAVVATLDEIFEPGFEYEDLEAFTNQAQLALGLDETPEIPAESQAVEPGFEREAEQIVGAVEGETAIDGIRRRIELKKLREQIVNSDRFFELNMPVDEERALGLAVASRLAAGRICEDEGLQRYVGLIGATLAEYAERDDLAFRFTVIESDAINAFAAPGGFIFITTGCIRACENEAELAAVLAHEIGHVDLRHGLRMMDNPLNRGRIARKMMGDEFGFDDPKKAETYAALTALADEHFNYVTGGWGNSFELEADAYGLELMAKVGWDLRGLLRFLEVLEASEGEEVKHSVGKAWATHPPSSDRIAKLRTLQRRKRLEPSGLFLKERFDEYTAGLNR